MRPSPGAWARIERLFAEALDRDPAERAAWVEASDEAREVVAETLRLLRAHEASGDFLAPLDPERAAALVGAAGGGSREPDRIGPYRVLRLLARGGMGIVYVARDDRLERDVALKVLPGWLETDPAARQRFLAEARAASRLDHPNILTVHDVGETPDGGLYMATAFYEGETLAERVARGPLPVYEALDLARQVADGLAAAHARGIVHRDVKPANVVVTPEGRARIVDFGIAKGAGARTTRTGVRLGTIAYMSPEQTRGEPIDARTDVWSFGALLYEMLTGRRPFAGGDDAVLIPAIRHDAPPPLLELRSDAPELAVRLVERCLQKDPAARLPDADAVAARLRGGPVEGSEPGRRGLLRGLLGGAGRRPAFRVPAVRAATALLLLVAGLGAATALWLGRDRPARPGEEAPRTRPGLAPLEPSRVLVLPFTAPPDDPELARLGRDLVITLAPALDGLGELRTVDGTTVAARFAGSGAEGGPEAGPALARELGAGRIVRGSLVRSGSAAHGSGIRAEVAVLRTGAEEAEANAAVEVPSGDIGTLTDSIALALVRRLWPSGRAPSVEPRALSTRSVPALRAFLEGELATSEGRWRDAPGHFARAIALDSTFWLAGARYLDAMAFRSRPADPELARQVWEHREELPERQRALMEAGRADSLGQRIAQARALTERYPDSWRAWFDLADQLIHNAMFLGATRDEARAAIERAVALNPTSSTLWQHLFWMALADRDSVAMAGSIDRLAALGADSASVAEVGLDVLRFFRLLQGLAQTGDAPDRAATEALARQLVGYEGPLDLTRVGGEVSVYGFPRGETLLEEVTLTLPVSGSARRGALRSLAGALAARGAWDSALVVLDEYVASAAGPEPLRDAWRLAAIGTWLGALGPGAGREWREALRHQTGLDLPARAEIAWLDGVVAAAGPGPEAGAGRAALPEARDRLRALAEEAAPGSTDSVAVSLLDRSLSALGRAAAGRREEAADLLLALERERAERRWFRRLGDEHPYLTAVNRLSAARWLEAAGRAGETEALLRWHQSVQFPSWRHARADASLRGVIEFRRARVAEALGRVAAAREHDARALEVLDLAEEGPLRAMADSARAALRL